MYEAKNAGDFALEQRKSVNQTLGSINFRQLILTHMDLQPGLNVLDVACGDGQWTLEFKKRVVGGFVAGIDQSEALIERSRKAAAQEGLAIDFRMADALQIPYNNRGFHRVSCLYAVYHFPDIPRALSEMIRVAKSPVAKIVLAGPSENNNQELYEYHQQAGGGILEVMGRYVFENSVFSFLEQQKFKHKATAYDNPIRFPTIEALLDYYKKTKLFLDNIKEAEREDFLYEFRRVVGVNKDQPIIITKKIRIIEIWI